MTLPAPSSYPTISTARPARSTTSCCAFATTPSRSAGVEWRWWPVVTASRTEFELVIDGMHELDPARAFPATRIAAFVGPSGSPHEAVEHQYRANRRRRTIGRPVKVAPTIS